MQSTIVRQLACIGGLLLGTSSGCIESVCESSTDCGGDRICDVTTGACVDPECSTTDPCPSGKLCEAAQCVVGCLTDQDCGDAVCIDHRCREMARASEQSASRTDAGTSPDATFAGADGGAGGGNEAVAPEQPILRCECPLAPEVCLEDINPASATFQEQRCIASASDPGTLLFFGNVPCSHCQGIFGNLLALQARLRADRLDPKLTFVQISSSVNAPEVVASVFPNHEGPVLQDTEATNAWSLYAADWYHVIVVDRHGCLGEHYRPPETFDLLDAPGDELEAAWRRSLSEECP